VTSERSTFDRTAGDQAATFPARPGRFPADTQLGTEQHGPLVAVEGCSVTKAESR